MPGTALSSLSARRRMLLGLSAAAPLALAGAVATCTWDNDARPGFDGPRPRRHERRPRNLREAWEERVRRVRRRVTRRRQQIHGPTGLEVTFELRDVESHHFPGWTDSNSPAYWRDGRMAMFNSAEHPVRSTGASIEMLRDPVNVYCTPCERPGGWWIEAVWLDPASGVLYGWYHFEPADLTCETAPIIGAATSQDGGLTWQDHGPVLENRYPIDCDYDNGFFVGGNGDFHVIPDQEEGYFYFLFSNYGGPVEEQGIGVARSPFARRGQPGTVSKFYRGEFREPGLGGRVTPIFPTRTGWKGPHVDAYWGPSVHWNEHVRRYIAVLNRTDGREWAQEGIYLTISPDLVRWSPPQKIMDSLLWYPQVVGLFPGGSDTRSGQTARLYVGGVSTHEIAFV